MPGLTTFPPFPENIPTHPLIVVDYHLIQAGKDGEISKLWKAATELGFWYLKNHGMDEDVEAMFDMGREAMVLPLDEKMKYELGDEGGSFGYKAAGVQAIDERGTRDTAEFWNVSKDDALAWPRVIHRAYPSPVQARMTSTIRPFVEKSLEINVALLDVFTQKLGLPRGALADLHRTEEESGCLARCIRAPPRAGPQEKLFIPAHTDYGSLTILHNRTGGLQVLPPSATEWYYVKPIPGLAICNIGDALNIFSGGILRSNIHRVVPPPGEQAALERWSVGFFTRPSDTAILRALSEDSALVAHAAARAPVGRFETGTNAKDWIARRVGGLRYNNYKDAEGWKGWKGTEDTEIPESVES
ncbi:Clavaminate synthase-like protein [Dichomitus squalens]|uniref:Clavaminate synthase-like protein n=1 Tax=Dichomitus squalens TaxID=114155 RepID=A0A4Q9PB47_9APHY|nr:Clavaminate synthase-like protein [Dichomitus squalens]TBU51919.1 Clavaminate synthase-like protein [Dichomitus squalens]